MFGPIGQDFDLILHGLVNGARELALQTTDQSIVPRGIDPRGELICGFIMEREASGSINEIPVAGNGASRARLPTCPAPFTGFHPRQGGQLSCRGREIGKITQ